MNYYLVKHLCYVCYKIPIQIKYIYYVLPQYHRICHDSYLMIFKPLSLCHLVFTIYVTYVIVQNVYLHNMKYSKSGNMCQLIIGTHGHSQEHSIHDSLHCVIEEYGEDNDTICVKKGDKENE